MSELMNTIRPYLKENKTYSEYGDSGIDCKGKNWERDGIRSSKSRYKDLTGESNEYFTILFKIKGNNEANCARWLAKCNCGNLFIISSTNFSKKIIKSCGLCYPELKHRPIIGEKYYYLTVIGQTYGELINKKPKERLFWICLCDCGNITYVDTEHLTGYDNPNKRTTKSCGCIRHKSPVNYEDLTGKIFGWLTALERDHEYEKKCKTRITYWKCRCKCGQIKTVSAGHLKNGNTKSCGCMMSKGEEKIQALLQENNIIFERQKQFPTAIFNDSGFPMKFDFFINNQFLLEYDGQQHYMPIKAWGGEERLIITQNKDNQKNNWCKQNNIILKRIPYTDLNKLTFEDIMSDKYIY